MDGPEISVLHQSDFYRIRNYKCNCTRCHTSEVEYSNRLNFCFVRSGYFEFRVFRRELEVHIGRIMVTKPNYEHVTYHVENQPDICSVFDFPDSFVDSLRDHYQQEAGWFFQNNDLHALLLACAPDLDYLHHLILQQTHKGRADSLLIDEWTLRLIDKVMRTIGNESNVAPLPAGLKRNHLSTIERAKNYIMLHFRENISLAEVAHECCVSVFHFSRLFKSILKVSPYQYLNEIRLNHARVLLESTRLSVTEIAFQSGFNTLENFDHAYRQRFGSTPTHNRTILKG